MAFETYIPRRGPSGGKASVRVLKSGDISVSKAAYDEWLKGANYVEFLYDQKSKKIGLKPRRKPTKASYKVRTSPVGGDRRYISAGQFLNQVGVKVGKAKTVEANWNSRDAVVEFKV